MSEPYIVVPAPGHYGNEARIISVHDTLEAATKACRSVRVCVRRGSEGVPSLGVGPSAKGDRWLSVYEVGNPILYRRAR